MPIVLLILLLVVLTAGLEQKERKGYRLMTFDPNKTKKKDTQKADWASYHPNRRPRWQLHDAPESAHNTMKETAKKAEEATLYREEGGKWTVEYIVEKPKNLCAACGLSLITGMKCDIDMNRDGTYQHLSVPYSMPGHPAPTHLRPQVCVDCALGVFGYYRRRRTTKEISFSRDPYDYPDKEGKMYTRPGTMV